MRYRYLLVATLVVLLIALGLYLFVGYDSPSTGSKSANERKNDPALAVEQADKEYSAAKEVIPESPAEENSANRSRRRPSGSSGRSPAKEAQKTAEEARKSQDRARLGAPALPNSPPNEQHTQDLIYKVKQAWEELPFGKIAFDPPPEMKVGNAQMIEVRISDNPESDSEFVEGIIGKGNPEVKKIKISHIMKVTLYGSKEDFQITPMTSAEQAVGTPPYTQWLWEVTPLASGERKLLLTISARINLPGYPSKDYTVESKVIKVRVNPIYTVRKTLQEDGEWVAAILTIIILPIVGLAWRRVKQKKEREENARRNPFRFE